jgi:death-on-curing protein
MRYLSLLEVLELHDAVISSTGGAIGIRDIGALESAVNQPRLTFDKVDLYRDIASKASALCHSLIMNHLFLDGNKRIGHAAMEAFLILNGHEIEAAVDEQEEVVVRLAEGEMTRKEFTAWVRDHLISITTP